MKHLSLAVVGADFDNKKGPTRRFEIAMCVPGEPVDLIPEPKNPADQQAVAVYSARGIQIGYVRAERAPLIRRAMERGEVSAIFQASERWGATIRAHLDGTAPFLPKNLVDHAPSAGPARITEGAPESYRDDGSRFYPDWIPPDD